MLSIKGQNHSRGLTHNSLPFNRAIIPRIKTIVPVIPHHKVMPFRHTVRSKIALCWYTRNGGDSVWSPRKILDRKQMVCPIAAGYIAKPLFRKGFVLNGLSVQDQPVLTQLQHISR